ncbi:MAG: hypothetical protein MK185_06650 [Saccharospirillaceae bacterium]|nr:hypothetical protein [Saccharospirillaceae bacterium]
MANSKSTHHLTGKPSNNRLPDDKKLKRRAFAEADGPWAEYTAAAEQQGMKTQEWMRKVLREALSHER